ncbi:MAG: hypothetical protein WC623_07050 [Pedobacter sp.]|uniref:hypothetical protein n=1 Tax=Pedobacter sp. TaxID=1411316 RepID=UPI003569B1CA
MIIISILGAILMKLEDAFVINGHVADGYRLRIYYGAADEFACGAYFSVNEILGTMGLGTEVSLGDKYKPNL